jgi:trimeric autotransporter adhesin
MRKIFFSLIILLLAYTGRSQSWSIAGNAGTDTALNFVGTTDSKPLRFRVNNSPAGEINHLTFSTSLGYLAMPGGGRWSTALGAFSLRNNTGEDNTAVGYSALSANTTGTHNTAMGAYALVNNTTGNHNTAIGVSALASLTGGLGEGNTAVGSNALNGTKASKYNTAIGYFAGWFLDLGWNNTMIGALTSGSFHGQYNMVAIGQGTICPDNSTARIGNTATWSIGGYANWTNFSDGRFKKDIQENVKGLEFIMKLRPVTYHLDLVAASKKSKENGGFEWDEHMKKAIAEKEKVVYSGFVAQEVEQVAQETGYDFSGVDKPRNEHAFYGLRYAEFVVPLVKAVQEQQQMIDQLEERLTELEKNAGITNNHAKDALTIYPNPSNNHLRVNIVAGNSSTALIKLFDSKGALVKQQSVNLMQGLNNLNMDIKHLPAGTYHLAAEWNNGQVKKTVRMVKQ